MTNYRTLIRQDSKGYWLLVNPTNLFEALRVGWLLWKYPDRIAGLIHADRNFVVERLSTKSHNAGNQPPRSGPLGRTVGRQREDLR